MIKVTVNHHGDHHHQQEQEQVEHIQKARVQYLIKGAPVSSFAVSSPDFLYANKHVSTKCLAQIHPKNTKLLPEEPGDDDSGSEMVAELLCLKSDVVVAVDNCFVADSCLVVSGGVAGGGGVAAGSYIVVGGGGDGDGGEAPHPPRSTYQTVNTSL